MSIASMDAALGAVSRRLYAFNDSFVDLRRMRKRLAIEPRAAIALADVLENDSNALILAAKMLRHEAQREESPQ
jgi:hypothetical protein